MLDSSRNLYGPANPPGHLFHEKVTEFKKLTGKLRDKCGMDIAPTVAPVGHPQGDQIDGTYCLNEDVAVGDWANIEAKAYTTCCAILILWKIEITISMSCRCMSDA